MGYLIAFHWSWLAASALLGLGMGWISVVTRVRPVSRRLMAVLSVAAAALIVLALTHAIFGRLGYWLDLALLMLAPYLVGCAIGSLLRNLVVLRIARRGDAPDGAGGHGKTVISSSTRRDL